MFENDFLQLFTNWVTSITGADKDGSFYDQSFAEICSSSFTEGNISIISGGPLTPLHGESQINCSYGPNDSSYRPNESSIASSEFNNSAPSNRPVYHPSPICHRSLSFTNLTGLRYDETFSIGTYSGNDLFTHL